MKLAVLIPTRNRAALAINAIDSLLDRQDCDLEVFVSDNSSSDDEVRTLAAHCRTRSSPRLTCLRPPAALTMGAHWDWAVRQVLARSAASHLTVHYDRKYSGPGAFGALMEVAARHPGLAITYPVDLVLDQSPPRLWQSPWSGGTYRMRTANVLSWIAAGRVAEMGQTWPILSNCVVPRAVLETIIARYGNVCDALGPDSRFAIRFCTLFDAFLHFDRSLAVVYATHRSAGTGFLRGTGGDFADFRESWGDRAWIDAAPIPGLNLGQNMLFHEYELVRREGAELPPIDRSGYLRELGRGLQYVQDGDARSRMRAVLEEHGWRDVASEPPPPPPARPSLLRSAWRRVRAIRRSQAVVLFLADHFGVQPRSVNTFSFRDDAEAIRYAIRYPFRLDPNPMLEGLELERV